MSTDTPYEPLPDLYISSSKSAPVFSVTVTNIETNNHNEDIEIHLLLSSKKLIDMQNDDIFCKAIMKLINEKKLSSSE